MKVFFAHYWNDPVSGQQWLPTMIGDFPELLAFSLIRSGYAVNAEPGAVVSTPASRRYATLEDLQNYVPWNSERDITERWFLRGSVPGAVSAATVPLRITGGSAAAAVVPATAMKLVLASAATGPITAVLSYQLAGAVTVVTSVTVTAGMLGKVEISEVNIPAGAVIDIVEAPETAYTGGLSVICGALAIEGIFS